MQCNSKQGIVWRSGLGRFHPRRLLQEVWNWPRLTCQWNLGCLKPLSEFCFFLDYLGTTSVSESHIPDTRMKATWHCIRQHCCHLGSEAAAWWSTDKVQWGQCHSQRVYNFVFWYQSTCLFCFSPFLFLSSNAHNSCFVSCTGIWYWSSMAGLCVPAQSCKLQLSVKRDTFEFICLKVKNV